jgi:hypothetical protein
MIITVGGNVVPPISDTDGGRISAAIGGDGGFIYSNDVCTTGNQSLTTACGAYGAWSAPLAAGPYGYANALNGGYVASRTFVSPEQESGVPWLARQVIPNDRNFGYNTMSTDLYMGINPAAGPGPANINMIPFGGAGPGGALNMAGGTINFQNGTLTGIANINPANVLTLVVPAGQLKSGIVMSGTMAYVPSVPVGQTDPNAPSPVLSVTGGCTINPTNDPGGLDPPVTPGCASAFVVTGDASVFGQLQAYNLFAGTFVYNGSDIRLKSNIHPINGALSDMMKLKPVSYTFKSNGQPGLGIIAQDLEKVYPQLVVSNKGIKYVNYEGLIGPLIEAVQELKKENDELRQQIRDQATQKKE